MGYLSESALREMNFKSLGRDVRISDKASIYNAELMDIGDYSRVDDFCILSGKVSLGRYCHVTPMCLIAGGQRSEEHTSELQSRPHLVCRLLLEKKK